MYAAPMHARHTRQDWPPAVAACTIMLISREIRTRPQPETSLPLRAQCVKTNGLDQRACGNRRGIVVVLARGHDVIIISHTVSSSYIFCALLIFRS